MPYTPCLEENVYDGEVDAVRVVWGPSAKTRLSGDAAALGVAKATLKALTEHFLYASAKRIGCAQVKILGAPHEFTANSATGESQKDQDHISGQFSAGLSDGLAQRGRYRVHVYLTGKGVGKTAYDDIKAAGERVMQINSKGVADTLREDLSTGTYPAINQVRLVGRY
ncbi:hypothetical protein F4801DRAFT_598957 [Xylaria longipes]|nr:hypothetical protein F4801DRAFT_598957 [Xylaria longipes]